MADLIVTKEKLINSLQNDFRIKEEQYLTKINELSEQLDEKQSQQKDFNLKFERLEKELIEMVKKISIRFINFS